MDYKVLYRKYRPKNFDEVVGQVNTVKLLKDAIINDKISHAYIFSGPRGTGKTSLAKIFAKTITCSYNKNGNPCEKCDNCLNFQNNSDIIEIDAASNNGVDQIREIIDNIKLAPIGSKYKVYIIDEVHMLSISAFNALLLTLEEPPAHAVFILATTNIENVPITVLSRCQRLDFRKINDEDIFNRLKTISVLEKIDITDDALKEIAFCADGGLRDALSILDQLSKETGKIDAENVFKSIGVISNNKIKEFIDIFEIGNLDKIVSFIDEIRNLSIDYKTFVKKLITEIKNTCIEIKQNKRASNIGYHKYKEMCFELSNTLYKSNVYIDSFSLLELIILDYVNKNDYVNKEEKIEDKIEIVPETNDDKISENKIMLTDIRINNCFVDASKIELNNVNDKWNDFISGIRSKKIKGILLDTIPALASPNYIVLKTEFKENADLINENLDSISEYYNKYCDKEIKFIGISYDLWQSKIDEYKSNLKNGIKYELISEENTYIEENIVDDIFSKDKIEID